MANREEMHPGEPAQWRLAPPGGVLVTHSVTPNATQYNKNGFIAEVFVMARCSEMYREYGAKHLKAPTVEVVPIQLLPLALHSIINIGLSSAIAAKHLLSRYILH